MPSQDSPRWTIRELGDQVAAALREDYAGLPSGQVSPVPGVRAIRYYAGLGLVDAPAEMRGRTAYYTTRHLVQLVAIKRLQEQGRSLAEVQAALTGASERTLRALARITGAPGGGRARRAPTARRAFWREPPAERFPVILASDVLYDAKNHQPLLDLVARMLLPDGVCWIGDPGRYHARAFLQRADERGFAVRLQDETGAEICTPQAGHYQLVVLRVGQAFQPARVAQSFTSGKADKNVCPT